MTTNKPTIPDLSSLEAEQAVLGSALLDPIAVAPLLATYPSGRFRFARHQIVWRAMQACQRRGALDYVLLLDELERGNLLDEAGGASYLVELLNVTPTAVYAEHYAASVANYALRRGLVELAGRLAALAYQTDPVVTDADLLDQAGRLYTELLQGFASGRSARPLAELVPALEHELGQLVAGQQPLGLPTGLVDLDRLMGGLFPADVALVAARPGAGKTALLLTLARNVVAQGRTVLFCSLEMSAGQLMRRLLAAETQVNSAALRQGPLTQEQWPMLSAGLQRLADYPLWIDDTPAAALSHIGQTARQLALREALALVVVDYVQLVTVGGAHRNRVEEVGAISRGLKCLARDLDVPVIAAAQLNRAVELRTNRTPTLADLRESGSLEQDSDQVILLHRPGLYDNTRPDTLTDLILAKSRHGPLGTVQAIFLPERQEFAGAAGAGVAHD